MSASKLSFRPLILLGAVLLAMASFFWGLREYDAGEPFMDWGVNFAISIVLVIFAARHFRSLKNGAS